jgi:hypothetical protein
MRLTPFIACARLTIGATFVHELRGITAPTCTGAGAGAGVTAGACGRTEIGAGAGSCVGHNGPGSGAVGWADPED